MGIEGLAENKSRWDIMLDRLNPNVVALVIGLIVVGVSLAIGLNGCERDRNAEFRSEMRDDNAALRAEVKADNDALRAEHAALRAEMKADNAALRAEVKADNAALRVEVKADTAQTLEAIRRLEEKLDSRFDAIEQEQARVKGVLETLPKPTVFVDSP